MQRKASPLSEEAQRIDWEGRHDQVPSLGAALLRAGCRDRAVLEHCREKGHGRGCWVIDGLLGRESSVRKGLITHKDWHACVNRETLLAVLKDKGTNRQWRLFAVACCRRIDYLISDKRSRRAVGVAGRACEGTLSEEELSEARKAALQAVHEAKDAEYEAEAQANFCSTPDYEAVCCRLYAARAALSAVCRDPRVADDEFGSFEARLWRPSHEWAAATVGADAGSRIAQTSAGCPVETENAGEPSREARPFVAERVHGRATTKLAHSAVFCTTSSEHFWGRRVMKAPGCH